MQLYKLSWRNIMVAPSPAAALAAAHRWEPATTRIAAGTQVDMRSPLVAAGDTEQADSFAKKHCSYSDYWAPPVDLACFPEVALFSRDTNIIAGWNWVFDELDYNQTVTTNDGFLNPDGRRLLLRDELKAQWDEAAYVKSNTYILHPRFHFNYYHWTVEGLSQLRLIRKTLSLFDTIAVPPLNRFRAVLAELLPENKFMTLEEGKCYRFRNAAICTAHGFGDRLHPWGGDSVALLREEMRWRSGARPTLGEPVYLTRNASGWRPMRNEKDLESGLAKLGFRIVNTDGMGLSEQVREFSRASLLVSPHGAGLTNMIYLPSGARAIELRPLNSQMLGSPLRNRGLPNLANLLDVDYGTLVFQNQIDHDEWTVDVPFVIAQLQDLLGASLGGSGRAQQPAIHGANIATASRKPILACFVPFRSEDELLQNNGTLGILAAEQYLIMKQEITDYTVELYDRDTDYDRQTDVLMLLTALPAVPDEVMLGFDRVVYFFEDFDHWKLQNDSVYAAKAQFLGGVLHPLQSVADQLAGALQKPSVGVPWSLARIPAEIPPKSAEPSLFVDMDPRDQLARSLQRGADFITAISPMAARIFVPESCHGLLPDHVQKRATPVPFLPHEDFLRLLGTTWFYASGIESSYEFIVLESAFLGCGLISLNSAIRTEHLNRSCVLHFDGQPDFPDLLKDAVDRFDASAIMQDARRLYSRDGIRSIPRILAAMFAPHRNGP